MSVLASPPAMTPCQEKAFDILQRQGNVFLTGAAGTGKSYLLRQYLAGKGSEDFPVIASTGAAAVLIGGRTFHSFFGLGILEGGVEAAVMKAVHNKKVSRRLARAQCVIIDEISMLSGSVLQAADMVARKVRGRDQPWGGLRMIVVGDFAQLPPIAASGMEKDWAFRHPIWEQSEFQPALLSTVVRTQELDFLEILNFVRDGIVNDQVANFLNSRQTAGLDDDMDATRLYAHRTRAEAHNIERLKRIERPLQSFATKIMGDDRYADSMKRALPIPETLHLKVGALIMMRKNDMQAGYPRFVNGSLGHITGIHDDALEISLLSGEDIEIGPEKFSYLDGDGEEAACAWNFPVTLAWATTIHKAQGASLDRLVVDLSALWEPGQAYVALSRVRSSSGLFVEKWQASSIRVEPLVTELYASMTAAMDRYQPKPLFLSVPLSHAQSGTVETAGHVKKVDIYVQTKRMLDECLALEEIAMARGVRPEQVLLNIETMLQKKTVLSLTYLESSVPDFIAVCESFERHGLDHMKPVYDDFDADIPYVTLRLVRCIMMAGLR
ncbi:MAG: helicase-like protein [Candidatus Peribacteria bacterium]|nr:helicase-like protein [Candidatus Peribacteria bacterium]